MVDLAGRHPVSRPAVSKHLRLLAEAGLVEVQDRGRERHYSLRPGGLLPVGALLANLGAAEERAVVPPLTTQALDALDTEVHRTTRDRRTASPTAAPAAPTIRQEHSA